MDPDATLNRLREMFAEAGPHDVEEVLELFISLDTWLLKGGAPPKEWQTAFGPAEVKGQLVRR